MKRCSLTFLVPSALIILPVLFFLPIIVLAGEGFDDIVDIFESIATEIEIAAMACAGIGFGIAAILFLTAGGNPSQVENAKKALLWAIVGTVVALIAGFAEFEVMKLFGI